MNGKKPPTIQCHRCKNYFPYYLQKTCSECFKILCPPCTILYQKFLDRLDSSGRMIRVPPIKKHVCATCHEKLLEDELREKEEENEESEEEDPEWMNELDSDVLGDSEEKTKNENQDSYDDYSEVETEYERQNKKQEKIWAEERKKHKFKCMLCTASSDFESSRVGSIPLSFHTCSRCGIWICNGCIREVPDNYDVPKGSDWFGGVCVNCYEGIIKEQADKWDREYKNECDWPNPYKSDEE